METNTLFVKSTDIKSEMDRMVEILVSGHRDPTFERAIQERAAKIREETFRTHGLLDIGVGLIREVRDRE